jgi:hypothetical protein
MSRLAISALLTLSLFCGCNGDKEFERVDYRPERLTDAKTVQVPAADGGATLDATEPALLPMPKAVGPKEGLAFEGTLELQSADDLPGAVLVQIYDLDADGRKVIANEAGGVPEKKNKSATYHIELQAPQRAGKYTADVMHVRPGEKSGRVLGRSEFEVGVGQAVPDETASPRKN